MKSVQDEGSQLVVLSTEAAPGETVIDYCAGNGGKTLALTALPVVMDVIDYCAGNGGKTLALAAMLANNGTVLAYDVEARRLKQLQGSLSRAGATCVETTDLARLQVTSPNTNP
ncbi:hypothetical protein T484DRAFT_1890785 [Baffinella frigidus]|nr:hypothetical protein T484DRAFT_1890785 [Cryptophyta sp. CCMP2293]